MQSIKNKISTCQQDKTLIKLASTVDMLFRPFSNHLSEKIIAALEVVKSSENFKTTQPKKKRKKLYEEN